MTKEDFEKLVEKDLNKDEILERVKTGLGVLNNDEEWYDICARQYELCNGNLGSFWQNLFKILDSHKYRKENLKIIEENEKKMIGMLEDMKKNMRSYIAKHPISKKNCGKEVVSAEIHDKIFPELIKVIFNEYKEPLRLIENRKTYLEDIITLWKVSENINKNDELIKITFKFDKTAGSHNITNENIKKILWDGMYNRAAWLTPYEYLINGKELDDKKIKAELEKIKEYDSYNRSRLCHHLTYKIFQIFVNHNLVEETDSNEYEIMTSNNKCAVLTTEIAVWIFDLLAFFGIHYKVEDINIKSNSDKKDIIKDSLRNKGARTLDLPIDEYRRQFTWRFTEYI